MSFFGRFLTKVKFFLIDRANRTRFSETKLLSDQKCVLKKILVLKMTETIGRKCSIFSKISFP